LSAKITWQDGVPFSEEFGDIYFSKECGLEETNHVFLQGNNLAERFRTCDNFTIIETGFGTGLNFFATWKLWQETAHPDATLNYISVEKYPLTADDIRKSISLWPELNEYVAEICAQQNSLTIVTHHHTVTPHLLRSHIESIPRNKCGVTNCVKLKNNITLTLIFDDVTTALPIIETPADAWFLDGFAPSKNPEMWNNNLYKEMARLTKHIGTFATFTAAGEVRRGLQAHGFNVEKVAGFGKKRHVLKGCLNL
jgi:tRNA 5-methylaminomethyl-2-thiouridine biosynthesis bifunctional protein